MALFRDRLPVKPYHTDDFATGLRIRSAERAALARYIQPNGPTHRYWLVYDIDRPGAAIDWSDRGAPPPSITAKNPANGHAHLIYGLETSVRIAPDAKSAPLRYAAAIDCELQRVLDADASYSGLICKNPLHPHWQVTSWEPRLYTLPDLDSWLDLQPAQDRRRRLPDYGLGRNCNLFDKLRVWAYRAIRQGWPEFGQWQAACFDRGLMYNAGFTVPLDRQEVQHTAGSVARYTFKRFSPAQFKAWAASKGRAGGKAKGRAKRDELLPLVLERIGRGCSQSQISRELGISQQTISNWLKRA
ncbi:TPA: replication initiation protein [Klebsiella pneumoniae]|nr:replication initiation protein [Klebsiella pneumoniae]